MPSSATGIRGGKANISRNQVPSCTTIDSGGGAESGVAVRGVDLGVKQPHTLPSAGLLYKGPAQ